MPLARARCAACSQPLADPPHIPVPVRCGACGWGSNVAVGADGQPTELVPAFATGRLLEWFAYARDRLARGALGVALGICPRCRAPLTLSPDQPLSLPCPHCKAPRAGSAADLLVNQWTEPWAKVEGADMDLEYRLATMDEPTAAGGPMLGVRVSGTRSGRPFHALVPIAQGEAMLRADATRGASAVSSQSLLGITGIGCAAMIGLATLLFGAIVVAIKLLLK